MQLPSELLVTLYAETRCVASLLVLAATSRLMYRIGQHDPRLRVLRQCYVAAKRHGREKPVHCMFSSDMADLRLELSQHAHRFALYPILHSWRHLPVRSLSIRGDLDTVAAVKLDALFATPGFYCHEISFTCVSFNDDEAIVPFLRRAFAACSRMRFNLCSLDPDSLVQLLRLLRDSPLRSFHFVSNFVDSFPADVLCDAIAPSLRELDVAGAGLGWDGDVLNRFLARMATTRVTHLSLTNNDIASISLPAFPALRHLNLRDNPLPTAHKPISTNPSLVITI